MISLQAITQTLMLGAQHWCTASGMMNHKPGNR